MPTRNVNLTEYYDTFIAQLLNTGRFRNASEVVRAGLRLLETHDREEEAKIEALRDAFKEGRDDYERGEFDTLKTDADIDRYFEEIAEESKRAI